MILVNVHFPQCMNPTNNTEKIYMLNMIDLESLCLIFNPQSQRSHVTIGEHSISKRTKEKKDHRRLYQSYNLFK